MFRSIDISNISALGSKLSLVTLTESFPDGSALSVITGRFDPAADFYRQPNFRHILNQVNSVRYLGQASFANFPDRTGSLNNGISAEPSTASIISTALLTLLSPTYMRLRSGPASLHTAIKNKDICHVLCSVSRLREARKNNVPEF